MIFSFARSLVTARRTAAVVATALSLSACAYSAVGNFTASDFHVRTYRSLALSESTGDRELNPLEPGVQKTAFRVIRPELLVRGYKMAPAEKADLVLYTGMIKRQSGDQTLVVRVSDRERKRLVWQRATSVGSAPKDQRIVSAVKQLAVTLPKADARPVAY